MRFDPIAHLGAEPGTESEEVEVIEEDEEDLDMHLDGGEDTGYVKSSGSFFTVRSRGVGC